jgi:MFS family permease
MLGSIAMRLVQGLGIDRYGAGRVWQWSMAIYAASLLAHLVLTTAYGPAVFLVRIVMQTSLAGIFGASITFVSLRVPPQRMAEMIGTLGTSGFIGILVGPLISDWLYSGPTVGRAQVDHMFLTAGGIAAFSTAVTRLATSSSERPVVRRRPGLFGLLKRYASYKVAIVAIAMGAGFAIPMTFLRPFAMEMRLSRIGLYFAVYAISAFTARLTTRQLFERYGNRPWIMVGMALLTTSFLLYLPASATWHLIAPGAVAGVAHAILFPSVISEGTTMFPTRYRGLATSMMLAMFDLGAFLGAPVVGAFLQYGKQMHSSAYQAMFAGAAGLFLLVTIFFGASATKQRR